MSLDAASRPARPAAAGELPGPSHSRRFLGPAGFAAIACTLAVAYTLYTRHVWEDYFITFRHSRNLAEGHGLVFQPGERVHGFTSPLGVLLPALCYLVTGRGSYLPGLWLFRVLSILAYAAGGALLLLASRADGEARRGQCAFIGLLYLLHVTLLDYAINGMETGFMALFVAWGFWLAVRGFEGRWGQVGLCWAGLMWTRPDSFVYVIAFTAVVLVFPPPGARVRPGTIARAASLCAVVYLPWFAWAWWYYGSPVPHTVVAKSMLESGPMVQVKVVLKETWDRYFVIAQRAYLPAYFWRLGDWHPGLILVSGALSVFACIYWAFPVRDRTGRMASLVFALLVFYFTAIPNLFSWYMPPAAALGLVAVARGVLTLAEELRPRAPRALTLAYLALGMVCAERAVFFAGTAYLMRVQQAEIEDGTRTRIGLWLKDHVRPGERVYLEPLGYIGYFSGAKMTDWPGLVAPEVVRLRREKHVGFISILPELRPEWVVLRPGEVEAMMKTDYFRDHYRPVASFDARPRIGRYGRIPGRSYVENDAVFTIYKFEGRDGIEPKDTSKTGKIEEVDVSSYGKVFGTESMARIAGDRTVRTAMRGKSLQLDHNDRCRGNPSPAPHRPDETSECVQPRVAVTSSAG